MAFDVPDYVSWLVWTFLLRAPRIVRQSAVSVPRFESQDLLEEFMEDMRISFVSGISDVVQAPKPPKIDYFKSLSTIAESSWVIYGLVLEKVDCRPDFYVGSATNSIDGAQSRFQDYDEEVNLPRLVKEALEDGYTITHRCILCRAPIPPPAMRFRLRDLFLTLEAIFSIVFGAMNSKARESRLPDICPWSFESFEYDGLCTHSAYGEGLRLGSAHGIPAEELEAHFEERVDIVNANRRRLYAETIESRRFNCDVCDLTCGSQHHLDLHFATQTHIDNVNGVVPIPTKAGLWKLANRTSNRYYDEICERSFGSKSDMDQHLGSEKHKMMAAEAGWPVVDDADVDHLDSDVLDVDADDIDVDDADAVDSLVDDVDMVDSPTVLDDVQHGPVPDFLSDAIYRAANEVDLQRQAKRRADNIAAEKYHCPVCDKSFPTSTTLNSHENTATHQKNAKTADEQGDAYVPPTPKPASKWGPWKARQRAANIAAKKHYCPICDKAFGDAAVLRKHLKSPSHAKKVSEPTVVDKPGQPSPEVDS